MKIDRLLDIVIYLLNHKTATAKQLSERFQVSVRTIQRDVESIALAGVPIMATKGSGGGYQLMPAYQIRNQFLKREDLELIVMALKSLDTGYDNARLKLVLDRYLSLQPEQEPKVLLDYSVTKEDEQVQRSNKLLEDSIHRRKQIQFHYRNAQGRVSQKTVQPLALRFQWYAWYLFAYDTNQEAYRTYKVARMRSLCMTDVSFVPHENVQMLLQENDRRYLETCQHMKIWCSPDLLGVLEEYFPDAQRELLEDGGYLMHLYVPPNERLWQALLLSMGKGVRVLEPASVREKLVATAIDFLSNYDIEVSQFP